MGPIIQDVTNINYGERCVKSQEDRIAATFAGRTIFITGGTGFMGKVLIEKLLRSCSGLKKIYLLVRPKKGKQPSERVQDILNSVLFKKVKEQQGVDRILSKVEAIHGDIALPGLGLSPDDVEKLRNEVSIVYHSAATVRFDEPLRNAVAINVGGTKAMLELAATLKNLDLFCYVSTAFVQSNVPILLEKSYEPPTDPQRMMNACKMLTDDEMALIEKKILGNIPNSYVYTKALAEELVVQKFHEIPAAIVRPSIVTPICREPVPGWVDNMNGPTGLIVSAGKGLLRTMYGKGDATFSLIPADMAIHCMLMATWRLLSPDLKASDTRIFNITTSDDIKVSWNDLFVHGYYVSENIIPFNGTVWYPGGSMTSNYVIHWLRLMFFQWLPAIFIDVILKLIGVRPLLMRIQRRIINGINTLKYFTGRDWHFKNTAIIEARKLLNERERLTYVTDMVDFNIIDYLANWAWSLRRFVLNESDESVPAAKKHMKLLWYVDKIWKGLWLFGLCYLLFVYFSGDKFDGIEIPKSSVTKFAIPEMDFLHKSPEII